MAGPAHRDIYPCHQFVGREGMRMGSVLDGTFDTAMQARFQHNTVLTKEKCSQCWARFYCSGGCQANAHAFNGDIAMRLSKFTKVFSWLVHDKVKNGGYNNRVVRRDTT